MASDGEPGDRVPPALRTAGGIAWRVLAIIAVIAVLVFLATQLAVVVVPLILALILSTLASPVVRWLERVGLPSALAALIVVVGGALALIGGLIALVPVFVAQAADLWPTVLDAIDDLLAWLQDGPLDLDPAQIQQWTQDAFAAVEAQSGELAGQAFEVATTTIEAITALVLTIILTFFLSKDGEKIGSWLLDRVPEDHRNLVAASGKRGWESLGGYVRGTATVALVDAVGIGLGLLILGVPLVLPLTVLVFFGGFIPIVGAAISGLLAVLVALASEGLVIALIVLGIVALVQQLESDVLQPMIMRRVVPLHPIVVLLVLAAGAKIVGIIGALLAVPLAAVVSAVGNEVRLRRQHPADPGPEPIGGPSAEDREEEADTGPA
jgi:putative heme transporter